MIGHRQIIEYRKQGKKPSSIFFEFDAKPIKSHYDYNHPERQLDYGFYPVVYVEANELPDLRFVVGCNVIVQAEEVNDKFLSFLDRLVKASPKQIMAGNGKELLMWVDNEWRAACQS